MFLLIFYSVNCLMSLQINLMTLWGVPTPRFGTSEPLKSSNQKSLSCSCCATSLNWCMSKVCHRPHRKSSLCRCVWKPAFVCLHVFFVSVSGSGTNKWAGDLYLTPRAKICFACWLFRLSSFASSNFFFSVLPMFSSFMSLFVYIQSGWKSQTQEDAARNKAVLSLSSSFPSPFFLAEMQAVGHAWGFQTSVCVGGPWRATPP